MTVPEAQRFRPLPKEEWPEEMGAALAALRVPNNRHPFPKRDPSRPQGMNILGTLAHHPELARAYHAFNGHVLFSTTLSLRQRELVVLRVAAVRDARYEWAQHVVQAMDVGMTSEEVDRVAEGPDASGWEPLEQAMLRAVDELVHEANITDGTWSVLAAELDEKQLMDLVFTVGAYDLLAMAMRSFGVEMDEDLRSWKRPSR